jgi:hypothetical protein
MIVVIQCAASKRPDAGRLVTASGKHVEFVANPHTTPPDPYRVYARPDDLSENGMSWRQVLLNYNESPDGNPLNLLPAYLLYENKVYGRLVDQRSTLWTKSESWLGSGNLARLLAQGPRLSAYHLASICLATADRRGKG